MKKMASLLLTGALMLSPQMVFAGTTDQGKLITFGREPYSYYYLYEGVYRLNPDGTGRELLVDQTGEEQYATVSDDGKMMVYSANSSLNNKEGDYELYLRNLETGVETRLTNNGLNDVYADISPDGSKIVFSRKLDTQNHYAIYVINSDGTGEQQLTSGTDAELGPRWSPDGTKIAYSDGYLSGNEQIYVMNADGTGKTQVTNTPGNKRFPSWSKDGSQLLFSIDNMKGIGTIQADGTGYKELTTSGQFSYAGFPKFSADGQTIIFTAKAGEYTLWSMDKDGNNPHQLSNDCQFLSDWVW